MRVRGLMSVKDGMPDSGWLAGVGRLMTALLACVVVVGVWGCSVAWGRGRRIGGMRRGRGWM
jgi:hypothetical protein